MPTATALENLVGDMTLTDLAQRSGKTVSEIVTFALGKNPARAAGNGARAAKPAKSGSSATRSAASSVNTRTKQGRAEFDARLLEAIRSLGTAKASDLKRIGRDDQQRRTALHRLLAKKQIRREGTTISTIYIAK